MGRLGEYYADGRNRIIDVVSGAEPATPVPTCPAWTVKDVLSHVTGICADILAGQLDGVATDAWTAAQVDARRDRSVAEIVAEWHETGPQIDGMVDQLGRTGEQLLLDLTTHEHDVRHAIGRPAGRDAAVLDVCADFGVTMMLDAALRGAGAGPIEIKADHLTWIAGGDTEAGATLTTTRFELCRSLTGRRSAAQIADMSWSTSPAPYVPAFQSGPFTFPATDIAE